MDSRKIDNTDVVDPQIILKKIIQYRAKNFWI